MRTVFVLRASVGVTALLSASALVALETSGEEMLASAGNPAIVETLPPAAAPAEEANELSFLFDASENGTFVIEVAPGEAFDIFVDGSLVLSVEASEAGGVGQATLQALVALTAGSHVITIKGDGISDEILEQIAMGEVGAEPKPLLDVVSGPATPDALELVRTPGTL